MSFIRTKEIPPGSGRLYEYEVESYREGGHVKQRHIRYIGRAGSIGTTGTGRTPLSSSNRKTPSIGTTPDKKSSSTPLTNYADSGIVKANKGEEKKKMDLEVKVRSSIDHSEQVLRISYPEAPILETGSATRDGITWTPDEAAKTAFAKNGINPPEKLVNGRTRVIDGQAVVEFDGIKGKVKNINIRLQGRDDLKKLADWLDGITKAESDARTQFWQKEASEQAKNILSGKPADSVTVKKIGSAPDPWEAGMSIGIWQSEDGRTFAGTPDKESNNTGYIDNARLTSAAKAYTESQAAEIARNKAETKANQAYREKLLNTVVPSSAITAYRKYRGDKEVAWEKEDEAAWAAINTYGEAIEVQGKY